MDTIFTLAGLQIYYSSEEMLIQEKSYEFGPMKIWLLIKRASKWASKNK